MTSSKDVRKNCKKFKVRYTAISESYADNCVKIYLSFLTFIIQFIRIVRLSRYFRRHNVNCVEFRVYF